MNYEDNILLSIFASEFSVPVQRSNMEYDFF